MIDGSHRLCFRPIVEFEPGTLQVLLTESYATLLEALPRHAELLRRQWDEKDAFAFSAQDAAVADCFFVTCLGGRAIGMGSVDPRGVPARGRIGQNCILPEHRGRGFGAGQLREMVRRLAERGASTLCVSTGEHPFFLPARRMHESCGFQEVNRSVGPLGRLVHLELKVPAIRGS